MSIGFGGLDQNSNSTGFFRGSELPRLLVLATVLAVGIVGVLSFRPGQAAKTKVAQPEPGRLDSQANWPARDNHPSFKTVLDKEKMQGGDNAAYRYLVEKARAKTVEELRTEASRDVFFVHLWDRPDRFRGAPIHLRGVGMRVLPQREIPFAKNQTLYEVWMRTPESSPNPYCVIFEDLPEGFPAGPSLDEELTFDGYFLKVLGYDARDTARGAPMLVGKLSWQPKVMEAETNIADWFTGPYAWMFLVVGAVLVYSTIRLAFQFRLFTGAVSSVSQIRSRSTNLAIQRPNDQLHPQELNVWLNQVANEPEVPVSPVPKPAIDLKLRSVLDLDQDGDE